MIINNALSIIPISAYPVLQQAPKKEEMVFPLAKEPKPRGASLSCKKILQILKELFSPLIEKIRECFQNICHKKPSKQPSQVPQPQVIETEPSPSQKKVLVEDLSKADEPVKVLKQEIQTPQNPEEPALQEEKQKLSFSSLPTDTQKEIVKYLDIETLQAFCCTSKSSQKLLKSNPTLMKQVAEITELLREFNLFIELRTKKNLTKEEDSFILNPKFEGIFSEKNMLAMAYLYPRKMYKVKTIERIFNAAWSDSSWLSALMKQANHCSQETLDEIANFLENRAREKLIEYKQHVGSANLYKILAWYEYSECSKALGYMDISKIYSFHSFFENLDQCVDVKEQRKRYDYLSKIIQYWIHVKPENVFELVRQIADERAQAYGFGKIYCNIAQFQVEIRQSLVARIKKVSNNFDPLFEEQLDTLEKEGVPMSDPFYKKCIIPFKNIDDDFRYY